MCEWLINFPTLSRGIKRKAGNALRPAWLSDGISVQVQPAKKLEFRSNMVFLPGKGFSHRKESIANEL
jgi:hypothetical protein